MRTAVNSAVAPDPSRWDAFARSLYYQSLEYGRLADFQRLCQTLADLDRTHRTRGNRLFYLAVPPVVYEPISTHLGASGCSSEMAEGKGWARIIIEKPFGWDLASAIQLNQTLLRGFREEQIFRIDHYMAKETVQNILVFRFANAIFEPVWNRRYIDSIHITAAETTGIENRAGYYEKAGVLRDMFQNHLMQLLALSAMEPPSRFTEDQVQDEKLKVFRSLRPFPLERLFEHLVLGQYAEGEIDGQTIPGYRQEPGVDPGSLTPTYARMRVFLDNWRWQGVPFYLTSGKRLAEKVTEIVIRFKSVPHSMFRQLIGDEILANELTLGIQPDEVITLRFQTKQPGSRVRLQPVTMFFNYRQGQVLPFLDAYEKVLLDCMQGDRMLFWRQDGLELCWSFLDPVLEKCETCSVRAQELSFYPAGGRGPGGMEAAPKNQE
jgi:glucose-6-phosphate 1-dehydrogenase